jgi:hypothetical protein
MSFEEFCKIEYVRIFKKEFCEIKRGNKDDKRRAAQKIAIKETAINAIKKFPMIEPAEIWKKIYISHVNNVSGVSDQTLIDIVISADNSWKKSSGHAFEEMICNIGCFHLKDKKIKLLLQKELTIELANENILNPEKDIIWLKEKVSSDNFDLYLSIKVESKHLIFGCIQAKTSIRDRVTRDREPSIKAMEAYFFSIAIVLDGEYLKEGKFTDMVNGKSAEFKENGWHSMYVFTHNKEVENDRIKVIDIDMVELVSDIVKAASFWRTQRQWLKGDWRP